ncbi:MAG: ABC transporter ATP-binding protein/permease [Mogibacterium sp.]|nr:ABC transporter ATP-binding protein/permease [Mogibacterium sp.]
MLELRGITKEYKTGAETVHALRGIDLAFRESEFVSILGPSGCGKTTMLNILGGLDQYTDGDLLIDGISTKEYKDADWDAYRNDTIGFVFQSYNLISHQTVLSNVELALTLSGVSASERKARAKEALEQVGLGDQINKRPAEMSGGQVQRVAIARALINDPSIILADEPTGALDTETSSQVMSILKEISRDRLVIMVTHNPDLAEMYSTRIVRLSDGQVISDSDPFDPGSYEVSEGISIEPDLRNEAVGKTAGKLAGRAARRRNKSMSLGTALHLSLNNLMTKKARTLLTAFAGSIGIIGIALILSVSSGFQAYIDKLEEDTLSSYPLSIQSETADMTSMITSFMAAEAELEESRTENKLREQQIMTDMLASIGSNDLAAFKKHVDSNIGIAGEWFNAYEYGYGISPTIYSTDLEYGPLRVSPGSIMQTYMNSIQTSMVSYANMDVFFQMMDNQELLQTQFDVVAGKWPEKYDELLLVLRDPNQLNDYIVYTLGLRDPKELKDMINEVMKGNEVESDNVPIEWTYDDFLGMEFALVNNCDTYRHNDSYDVWEDMSKDDDFMEDLIKKSEKLHITGIVCPKDKSGANAMNEGIGYLPSLTQHMFDYAKESDIVKIQLENKNTDVFSGKRFEDIRNDTDEGLGFEDMISIDEGKLKKALGGDIDPNAIQKDIENIAKKEIRDLSKNDSAEKIEDDVNKALLKGCEGMVDYILKKYDEDPEKFTFDNSLIDEALGKNLNDGKHSAVINPMLKAYAEVLKSAAPQIMQGIAAATDKEAAAAAMAQAKEAAQKQAAPELLKAFPPGLGLTEEDAVSILMNGITATDLIEKSGGLLNQDMAGALAAQLNDAAGQINQSIDNTLAEQAASMQVDPAQILKEALTATVEPFTTAKELQDGIRKYGEGIEMMQNAKVVGPALGKAAEAVGKQFNVDPSGIADAFTMKMDEEELTRLITAYISGDEKTTYEGNLRELGYADINKPVSMSFYLRDFESKEAFLDFLETYNKDMQDSGDEDMVISYTDITGVMIKSLKTITNAVSYVLIAFVAISLIVSSIMIGVITYISVLERTKEIGILRAIGASKKDISRIFNAETIIIGACAGIIGIGVSLLLLIPINAVLLHLTGLKALKAVLPAVGGAALVIISILLTFIAGLIPSGMAARKDPVVALRTE